VSSTKSRAKQQELLVVAELPPVLVVVAGSSTAERAGRELHGHGPTAGGLVSRREEGVERRGGRLPWCHLGMGGRGEGPRRRHIKEEERRAARCYSSALVGTNSAASSSSASRGRRTPLRRALLAGRRA
jgi:hypothetical protein